MALPVGGCNNFKPNSVEGENQDDIRKPSEGGWFQSILKICNRQIKDEHFLRDRGENRKYLKPFVPPFVWQTILF